MAELFTVTTNCGRVHFALCCPGCGNKDWDTIENFPEWRKCHHCDIQVKPEMTKMGYLHLVILTEREK